MVRLLCQMPFCWWPLWSSPRWLARLGLQLGFPLTGLLDSKGTQRWEDAHRDAKNKIPVFPLTCQKPEDHWSCIAHLSAEDMLKSAVIEEKKFKHSPWAGADNSLRPKFLCQQEGLITMAICCKFKKNLFNLTFHDLTNVYSCRSGADNPRGHILMSTVTSCRFSHLLQVSKNLSEVWFYTFFSWFYTCI